MNVNINILLPLLITSFVTMAGWFLLHRLARQRDIDNKKKELRVNYLIEAWRKLEYAAGRNDFDKIEHLEKPVADIQLFGTKKQIELVLILAGNIVDRKPDNLKEILNELRKDLRKELNIDPIDYEIKVLRIP